MILQRMIKTCRYTLPMLGGLLLAASLVVTMAGCTVKPAELTMVTGGTGGTYYPIGTAIAGVITDNVANAEATAVTSDGSVANAKSLGSGEAELALIENTIAYYAEQGIQMFEGEAVKDIRGIATLYPEIVQIVTLKEYDIKSLADLKGKRVGVGAPGSGTAVHALAILKAAGMDETNVDIQYLDFSECADGLKNGTLDAGYVVAGTPTSAITDLASVKDIAIVTVPGDIYNQLSSKYPFYVAVSLPGGTYAGVNTDVQTIAVMAMLATTVDVSKDLVYEMTRAIFENTDVLAAAHPRGKDITLESALDGMSIPLHPGAEKYYEE
jgi:TRAP transporter TAXI family solute receptor